MAKTSGDNVVSSRGRDILGFSRRSYTPINTLLKHWRKIKNTVGNYMLITATSPEEANTAEEGVYSSAAEKMMAKMGWERGEGLGKEKQGTTTPHLPGGQVSREGLGLRARRKDTSKEAPGDLSTKLKALPTSPGNAHYGYEGERNGQQVLEVTECTGQGRLFRTGLTIPTPHDLLDTALLWDGGPIGSAISTFPHPSGWTFAGAPEGQTLEYMTIRKLTALYRLQILERPSCETVWPKALKMEVPMNEVWGRFSSPNITPRDSKNAFRIVHRSIRTRNLRPAEHLHEESPNDEAQACRLCLVEKERFSHIGTCYVLRKLFRKLTNFANLFRLTVSPDPALIYLGLIDSRTVLPGAISDLHIILWKFALIDFVQVDVSDRKFEVNKVWLATVNRFNSRLCAHRENLHRKVSSALRLGHTPPNLDSYNRDWSPILTHEYEDLFLLRITTSDIYTNLLHELDITD
jgi:hypothetical protein